MKKLYSLILWIAFIYSTNVKAQITFEHAYVSPYRQANDFCLTNLGNNNYKYVLYDKFQNVFSLYNLDHTPYLLNIQVPITDSSGWHYSIGYITNTLFDCDSTNIEYAVIGAGTQFNFYIFRTDGTLLFSRDSTTTLWCVGCFGGSKVLNGVENTPAGTKLYLVSQESVGTQITYVYSLCGILPDNITEINQSVSYVKVFPTPASNQINFEINVPSHLEKYELTVFNSAFQTIKTMMVDGANSHFILDGASLSSGEYLYTLQNKNKVFQTGKFILSK